MPRIAAVVLASLALLSTAVPAHAAVSTPTYCGTNPNFVRTLPDDREIILTEHKLYFHGTQPSGDVDVRQAENNLFMNETAPTSETPKEKINLGGAANEAANKNSLAIYWVGQLPEEQRIVCGTYTFHAATTEAFRMGFFVDQPRGTATASATATASTTGTDQVNEFKGTLGKSLDVLGSGEIVIQALAATAAPVLYDSTTYNGSFTYLTVEIGGPLP
jgi:hypothetical protein